MKNALILNDVYKSFGKVRVIQGLNLTIQEGEIHAIIGPNGAGKSTLFNLVTGRYRSDSGTILLNGDDITNLSAFNIFRKGLSRSFQVTNIFSRMSVVENIQCSAFWSLGYGYSFWKLLNRRSELHDRCDEILEQTGLTDKRNAAAGLLSYSDQRALELAITLAGGAKVIMLDEPTSGMSSIEASKVVDLIRNISIHRTAVIVEHDMGVVFNLADRISVLVYGKVIATGTPSEIRQNNDVKEAYLGKEGH